MILKITRSAYKLIKEESRKHKTETGGLLIGPSKTPIGIRATGAGNFAKSSFVAYTNDSDYDNRVLQEAIKEFNGRVKLLGYWHKHPGNMSYPSSGDLATAQGIVKRNEQEGDKRPVFFIITNVVDGEVKLYCYMLDDNKEFVQVAVKIIDDNSKEIEKTLDAEPVIIQPRTMDFWSDADFQFYLTKYGYERLQSDVDELRTNGYDIKAYTKGQLCLVIKKDNEAIMCMPPPEYPLNPPRFFKGTDEIKYTLPIWNSSFRMVDILKNLEKLKVSERRIYESHHSETGSGLLGVINKVKRAIKSLRPCKKR